MSDVNEIILKALQNRLVIPAFNIPYLPMMRPVLQALKDSNTFGLIDVARLEWVKFSAGSPETVAEEYFKNIKSAPDLRRYSRLHLDHIPVIDEDGKKADYRTIISRAIDCGFESVMIDGSRLDLSGNIESTAWVCKSAHASGIPVEGELGAVLGHEEGPLPPYEELFKSGRGFTDPEEAARFVKETGVDWLSIAFGNIHGAITPEARKKEKTAARLDIGHLKKIRRMTGVPIVLHGGSGIRIEYVLEAVENGVAKINVASDIRRSYEAALEDSEDAAQEAVRESVKKVIVDFGIRGSVDKLSE